MKPAPVLYVEINEDGTVGGSYQCLYDLVRLVDRERYDPRVVFYQDNIWVPRLQALGVPVFVWQHQRTEERALPGAMGRVRAPARVLGAVRRRMQFLANERISLVHLNNSPSVTFQDWLPAAKLRGIPCITHARGNVFTPHRRFQRALITRYDRVLPISRHMADAVGATGIAPERISMVHDGVDLASWRARRTRTRDAVRAELGIDLDQVMVTMVGHLRRWKGQRQVLDALEMVPAAVRTRMRVVFVGDVSPDELDYRSELEQLIRARGRLEARLLGPRGDVPDLVGASDIALHASIEPEPFGLVVVEALALGIPVIASPFGGPAEVLTPETGILADPRDPAILSGALTRLAGDAELRARLGLAGPARAEAFSIARTVSSVEAIYAELLDKGTL